MQHGEFAAQRELVNGSRAVGAAVGSRSIIDCRRWLEGAAPNEANL